MKTLSIKNRSDARLCVVFCTISPCKCVACRGWLAQEKHPIVDWRGATYGYLKVEVYAERMDWLCDQWRCLGACFFTALPEVMKKDMLFELEENRSYEIEGGRAQVCLSGPPVASSIVMPQPVMPSKYVVVHNLSNATLCFVYCTVSLCKCELCLTWLDTETRVIPDWKHATYGHFKVKAYSQRVERICEHWKSLGVCFFGSIPERLTRGMLGEFEEENEYTKENGRARVRFTHTPTVPKSPKYVHIQNHSESTLYFAFCTNSPCKCPICRLWINTEKSPIVNWGHATYGYLPIEPLGQRIDLFCDQWSCIGACFFYQLPQKMEKEMLGDLRNTTTYDFGLGRATLRITDKPDPSVRTNYVHVQNLSDSVLFFAFCTVSRCKCAVCLQWLAAEKFKVIDERGWTVGQFVVGPNRSYSVQVCPQWECLGTCFIDKWTSVITRSMLGRFQMGESYMVAGGKARLSLTTAQSVANESNHLGAHVAMVGAPGFMAPNYDELATAVKFGFEVTGGVIDLVGSGCVIS